jgi:hypothetical protein
MLSLFLAGAAAIAQPNAETSPWAERVREKYEEFARKLEKGDPSFLKFVDRDFVYIGPEGARMNGKEWGNAMRAACRWNRQAKVQFRITEIKVQVPRVRVSYVWSYRFETSRGGVPLPRLSESISTDTWVIRGNDLRLAVSKDFRIWHRLDRA